MTEAQQSGALDGGQTSDGGSGHKKSDGQRRKESIPKFEQYRRESLELSKDSAKVHDDQQIVAKEDEKAEKVEEGAESDEECQDEQLREKPWKDLDLRTALAKYREKPGTGRAGRGRAGRGGRAAATGYLEYELEDMYPEMSLLTEQKKRDWDFHDPALIRAMWLESKTNVLAEWKFKYGAKVAKGGEGGDIGGRGGRKPKIEVRGTMTTVGRLEYRRQQEERRLRELEQLRTDPVPARDAPDFGAVDIASNATTDMRMKFNKNDPTVPRYYLEHFHRYRKPPFRTAIPVGKRR